VHLVPLAACAHNVYGFNGLVKRSARLNCLAQSLQPAEPLRTNPFPTDPCPIRMDSRPTPNQWPTTATGLRLADNLS